MFQKNLKKDVQYFFNCNKFYKDDICLFVFFRIQ